MDGSGAVHTVLPGEAFGGHVPFGGSEMYWFDLLPRLAAQPAPDTLRVKHLLIIPDLIISSCSAIMSKAFINNTPFNHQ